MKITTKYIVGILVFILVAGAVTIATTHKPSTKLASVDGQNSTPSSGVAATDITGAAAASGATADSSSPQTTTQPQTAQLKTSEQENFDLAMTDARKAFLIKDYQGAIKAYTNALRYNKSADTAHAGLYTTYTAMQKWSDALREINKAIDLAPTYTDYWKWKITLMDERMGGVYADLKATYDLGLTKVDPKTKINLVTFFARIAEKYDQKADAIAAWQNAIKLYPDKTSVYQAEIDRIQSEK